MRSEINKIKLQSGLLTFLVCVYVILYSYLGVKYSSVLGPYSFVVLIGDGILGFLIGRALREARERIKAYTEDSER